MKKTGQQQGYPAGISSLSFNGDGSLLAVAASYAFEEGDKENRQAVGQEGVFIWKVDEAMVRPKKRQ